MSLVVVILAAGQGTRMKSRTPKVLHSLGGKQLLRRVCEAAHSLNPRKIIVLHSADNGDVFKASLAEIDITWVLQEKQLGTGHAVAQTSDHLQDDDQVLILYGDVPLMSQTTLQALLKQGGVALITANVKDPNALGRIIRNGAGDITEIVEAKDATTEQLKITEINSGILTVPAMLLKKWLPMLSNKNAQGEYYLTDIIALAVKEKHSVNSVFPQCETEILGVNTREQLINLERCYQEMKAKELMSQGVTIMDPKRFDLRGDLVVAQDVTIDINAIIEGKVSIGKNSIIGPNVILKDTSIGENVYIKANSVLDGATIADNCEVGPFARLRPGTVLEKNSRIGNFVETKKAILGENSKANHLSYIGDAVVGTNVNIGAGTITCNYDGANKHQTNIDDGAFIGSATQLVAPVTIGKNATIGAGSTISQNAPADELTLARAEQRTVKGWKRPKKIS